MAVEGNLKQHGVGQHLERVWCQQEELVVAAAAGVDLDGEEAVFHRSRCELEGVR